MTEYKTDPLRMEIDTVWLRKWAVEQVVSRAPTSMIGDNWQFVLDNAEKLVKYVKDEK